MANEFRKWWEPSLSGGRIRPLPAYFGPSEQICQALHEATAVPVTSRYICEPTCIERIAVNGEEEKTVIRISMPVREYMDVIEEVKVKHWTKWTLYLDQTTLELPKMCPFPICALNPVQWSPNLRSSETNAAIPSRAVEIEVKGWQVSTHLRRKIMLSSQGWQGTSVYSWILRDGLMKGK